MRVISRVFVSLAAVLAPLAVLGQASSLSAADNSPNEQTVQIVLYPSPEPRPALKYQLLPPFVERRPGNAAVYWSRMWSERAHFFTKYEKEYYEPGLIGTWMKMPLGDAREKEYREKELVKVIPLLRLQGVYADMERAVRCESCDWQLPIREGNLFSIVPAVQEPRRLARMLEAKVHLEIAEGNYDEAVRTLQTGYAQARQVAQGPTTVEALVGVTIAGMMSHKVEQLIQQPDAPNLYWALSTLPRPLVDFRPAGELDSSGLYLQFPELRDLNKKRLSPEGWRDLLRKVIDFSSRCAGSSPAVIGLMIVQGYPRAKRHLIEQGRPEAEVEAMPVAQVVLLYTMELYEEVNDDQFKWFFLPTLEVGDGPKQAEQRLQEAAAREIIPLASFVLPASTAARNAETSFQWNLAMLRVFEAMRVYAAVHEGRWPNTLSDIIEVPIPTNPYDNKPFVYERRGDKAVLTSEKGAPGRPWKYEITLMPKAK